MKLATNNHTVSAAGLLDNRLLIQKYPTQVEGRSFPASISYCDPFKLVFGSKHCHAYVSMMR